MGPQVQPANAGDGGLCQAQQQHRQCKPGVGRIPQRQGSQRRHHGRQTGQPEEDTQDQRHLLLGIGQPGLADEPQWSADGVVAFQPQQVAARCLGGHLNRQQRVAVRNRPIGHRDLVTGPLFVPAAQAVPGIERGPVYGGQQHFQVPALGVGGGRYAETDPHHLARGQGVNRVGGGALPGEGGGSGDFLGGEASGGVNPVVTPVLQQYRLVAGVQVQHGARLGLCRRSADQ